MSRYFLLILLNTPLIIAGITGAIVDYKLKKTAKQKFIIQMSLWTVVLFAVVFAGFINSYLTANNLTSRTAISYFDIAEITAIIFLLFIANRTRIKADSLERRLNDLHQELSIILANHEITKHTDTKKNRK